MPGYLLTETAQVACAHQGQATPATGFPRVKLGGAAAVLQVTPYTIAGCTYPPNSGGPDATGQWTSGTTRVKAGNQPLAIQGAPGTCAPTGVPMTAGQTQQRVRAT